MSVWLEAGGERRATKKKAMQERLPEVIRWERMEYSVPSRLRVIRRAPSFRVSGGLRRSSSRLPRVERKRWPASSRTVFA